MIHTKFFLNSQGFPNFERYRYDIVADIWVSLNYNNGLL